MIEKEYLIWLAGFYEGEGSCGFYVARNRNAKHLQVAVWQKESQVLLEIKDKFGYGNVSRGKQKKEIRGKYHDDCYKFEVVCDKAKDFLIQLLPFMRSTRKIQQAKIAIEGWDNREIGMSKEMIKKVSVIRSKIATTRDRLPGGQFCSSWSRVPGKISSGVKPIVAI